MKKPPKVIYLNKFRSKRLVPEKQKPGPTPTTPMSGLPAMRREVDPDSHRLAWREAFGPRLRIDEQSGFWLDDIPISLDDLMLATNRIRRAKGQDPVGRKPAWLP